MVWLSQVKTQKLSRSNLRLELQITFQGGYLMHNIFEFSSIEKRHYISKSAFLHSNKVCIAPFGFNS